MAGLVAAGALSTVGLTSESASAGTVIPGSTSCKGYEVRACAYLYTFRPCGTCKLEIRGAAWVKDRRGGVDYDVRAYDLRLLVATEPNAGGLAKAASDADGWADEMDKAKTAGTRYWSGTYWSEITVSFRRHGSSHTTPMQVSSNGIRFSGDHTG